MTDSQAVDTEGRTSKPIKTYEQTLRAYEEKIMSIGCSGCWDGCGECLGSQPEPPNPEEYKDRPWY